MERATGIVQSLQVVPGTALSLLGPRSEQTPVYTNRRSETVIANSGGNL
jgi:hypothetical protein